MHRRLIVYGLIIWAAATLLLRFAGQNLLAPSRPIKTAVIFLVSFPLMAWVVRRLCRRFSVPSKQWPAAAISIALPTLLFDPFSSAFFTVVFPNIAPQMAGVFGGWMLWCCAGALVGATMVRTRES